MCPSLPQSWLLTLAQMHLSGYVAPHLLVVICTAFLLWLPKLSCWGVTPNAFNVALAHVPPVCRTRLRAAGPRSTLCDWWQVCPHSHPPCTPPRLGQLSVSWAHLCGAQELHFAYRHHSYLAMYDSLGGHKAHNSMCTWSLQYSITNVSMLRLHRHLEFTVCQLLHFHPDLLWLFLRGVYFQPKKLLFLLDFSLIVCCFIMHFC